MLKVLEGRKLVIIDYSVFVHRAIFAWAKTREMPSDYMCYNSIVSNLRRVGLHPDDTVLFACDSHGLGNWRKDLDSSYKASREGKRKKSNIDFPAHFTKMDELLKNIEYTTPFYQVIVDKCEADDVMSWCVRNFSKNEVVLVTIDSDMEQLSHFPNVKIFSPMIKIRSGKGGYKIIKNPLKDLEKKIDKELADDLQKLPENCSEREYEIRRKIVTLISLPKEVDNAIKKKMELIPPEKEFDVFAIKFKGIKKKFVNIFNNNDPVTYNDSLKKAKQKRIKKKNDGKKKTTKMSKM